MATKKSTLLNKPVYHGEEGNQSKVGFNYTFAADASGTIIEGRRIPAGCRITGYEYVNAALGTSVTMTLKVGDTTIGKAIACATAGQAYVPVANVDITADSVFTVTVGGAAATGALTVRLIYEYVGTL